MKRLLIIFLSCYCAVNNLFAQNYIAEYNSIETGRTQLLFNANEWHYDVTTTLEITIESSDIDVGDLNEKTPTPSKSISLFNYRSLDKNEYLDEELSFLFVNPSKSYVIRGKLEKPEWNILSDSVKMIEGYTCLMAKGFVRGRDYTVWFTPDIPVSAGPWKIWGLPGLIVDVQSDDGEVEITMTSLKQTNIFPQKPKVAKTVSPEEFKVLFQNEMKKFSRRMQSLSEGSSEVTVSNITIMHPDKSLFE